MNDIVYRVKLVLDEKAQPNSYIKRIAL